MRKISRLGVLFLSFAAPLVVAAQTGINVPYLKKYSDAITSLINYVLIPVLMAIAFIVFLWGVYKYFILGAADEKSREEGRQFTLWGIIGFVVIVSLWGIVYIFMRTLGLSAMSAPPTPTIGTSPAAGNQNIFGLPIGGQASGAVSPTNAASNPSSSGTSGGTTGASCTGSGQSTCAPGYICEVVGEGYNSCQIPGCTVASADNYNAAATFNNGSCTFNNAGAGL